MRWLLWVIVALGSSSCRHEEPPVHVLSQVAVSPRVLQHPPKITLVDIPRLAFAQRAKVDAVLGRPWRVRRDANGMSWSEGEIFLVEYRNAECGFINGRLHLIIYKFRNKPRTVAAALELAGIPKEPALLSGGHSVRFPFNAGLDTGDPIRFEDLTLRLVLVGEDSILVNFANVNAHYADWPAEVREAWLRSGARPLTE